ncbi:tetratricopeptide repeat protein [Fulvivirga sediminis]|uniref:Tetratricopeptide repeat protein n=1 Tax=Fulvivirga sediminis TaxID=2803949 RepID=A0A937FCW2_9BACT|nr:hypothetical protein [Fulvivirga sediminis]MBL3658889.1 hypothetical protein [Fulvivirga sediminis]
MKETLSKVEIEQLGNRIKQQDTIMVNDGKLNIKKLIEKGEAVEASVPTDMGWKHTTAYDYDETVGDLYVHISGNDLSGYRKTIEEKQIDFRKYNDIAYYLEQSGAYVEAENILNIIIDKYPERTVAYINLGDAYWGLGKKEEAREAYYSYIHKMKEAGKESKIPTRVHDRLQE